jgi:hypothetical protein
MKATHTVSKAEAEAAALLEQANKAVHLEPIKASELSKPKKIVAKPQKHHTAKGPEDTEGSKPKKATVKVKEPEVVHPPVFHGIRIKVSDEQLERITASAIRYAHTELKATKIKKATNVRQLFRDAVTLSAQEQLANFVYREYVAQCKEHARNPHFYTEAIKAADLSRYEL